MRFVKACCHEPHCLISFLPMLLSFCRAWRVNHVFRLVTDKAHDWHQGGRIMNR